MSLTITSAVQKALVERMTASGGPYHGAYAGLYVNTPALSADMTMSAFEEPATDTYTRLPVTWSNPSTSEGDAYEAIGSTCGFWGDSDNPVSITGVFLASAISSGIVLAAENLGEVVQLVHDDDLLTVAPEVSASGEVHLGEFVVI